MRLCNTAASCCSLGECSIKLMSLAAFGLVVLGSTVALAQTATNADGTPRQRPIGSDISGRPATKPSTAPTTVAPKPNVAPVAKPAPQPVTQPAPNRPIVVTQPPHHQWSQGRHPYGKRHHGECQEKAFRLHSYERRAAEDGRISRSERATIRSLQHDLDRSCGRFRWNH